jgi:sporulation protein YlmC with PRC-barrel domain
MWCKASLACSSAQVDRRKLVRQLQMAAKGVSMRLRDVLRKAILTADEGETLGRIDDVLLDRSCHHAVGLLVATGMLSRQYVVPFSEVHTVGRDAVIVRTSARVLCATDWLSDGHDTQRGTTITGKTVLTSDGAQLGTIHDLDIEDRTGRVRAIDIEAPGSAPSRAPHSSVPTDADTTFTNEVVVVRSAVSVRHQTG